MSDQIKIMIVDDQRSIRTVISHIVTDLGAEVVAEAEDGEQAIENYKKFKPDMVMMDINMPKIDGIVALKAIMEINPKALIIMLTSLDSHNVIKECVDAGAKNFLLKNISPDEIAEEIKESWQDYLTELKSA
ncbi:MAG: response regulator [Gammaproteobacteria bacterium]|nr:response regulator [Gammaproteobacteria bacterium]